MNRLEHYLSCLGEEGSEVAQRVSKALRFGLSEIQPDQPETNADRIVAELKDTIAVVMILQNEFGAIRNFFPSLAEVAAKRDKIERHMAISRAQGVLSDD